MREKHFPLVVLYSAFVLSAVILTYIFGYNPANLALGVLGLLGVWLS